MPALSEGNTPAPHTDTGVIGMARGETHHGAEVTAWELADLFYAGDETVLDDEAHQEQCCSGTVRCACVAAGVPG